MKKITLIATVLSMALSANAQLKVSSNGQVIVGKTTTSSAYKFKFRKFNLRLTICKIHRYEPFCQIR